MGILCRHAIRVVLGVIALSFGAAWATEPAWPGFRGPDANPIVPNGTLPEKWSKTENVEWAAEIPGRGWSSPIVYGRRVFLTTVDTAPGRDRVQQRIPRRNDEARSQRAGSAETGDGPRH